MSMSSTIAEVTFYIIIYGKDGDGMAPTAFGTAMVEPIRGIRAVRDLCRRARPIYLSKGVMFTWDSFAHR